MLCPEANAVSAIPDITQSEEWVFQTTLKERYGRDIDLQYADAEIRLSPSDKELTSCPVVYWQADDCNFVIFKTGDRAYRCQFFYRVHQQYGTGNREYDDPTECIVSLLQAQADHAAQERGDL
jgi:hypothetical protein